MNEGQSGWGGVVMVLTIAFVLLVVGFFLFPSVNTAVTDVDDTGWLSLVMGIKVLIPYIFLGAIFLGIIWLWKGRGG